MPVRFAVVPQWQGSGSSRAMRLVDGAEAIAGDLPAAATIRVEVPLEAGDAEGTGIARHSSLRVTRQRYAQALEGATDPVITIGGDCSVEYPAVARAAADRRVALLWLDAHPDAHSPATSPSHAATGMVLRSLVDDGHVAAADVVIVGARAWDDGEEGWVADQGIRALGADATAEDIAAAIAAIGADALYVHVDLDVLDPAELTGLADPEPFGMPAAVLVEAIRAAREAAPLAGAGVCCFSPASAAAAADDLGTILRIIGALTRGV